MAVDEDDVDDDDDRDMFLLSLLILERGIAVGSMRSAARLGARASCASLWLQCLWPLIVIQKVPALHTKDAA